MNKIFSNHPKGLTTLFLTEMWERMSYYGMRGILILFMIASYENGGLNFDNISASAIYGIYASSVYLATLPGGWIADRLIGQQKAIFYGGLIIMLGHISLIFPHLDTFYLGLILIVIGTGLLKPNISAIVGELYKGKEQLKDAGFTIFYMAINVGSILGFFICGYLGENIGWHYGFSASAIGMALGLIQFSLFSNRLEGVGKKPIIELDEKTKKHDIIISLIFSIISILILYSFYSGIIIISPLDIASYMTLAISLIAITFFMYIFLYGNLSSEEKKKMFLLAILFLGAAIFWSGFDQAGSSFNIFAKEYTNRIFLGWEYPASWLQILNPLFVVLLSPFIAYLWIYLGKRMLDPHLIVKFGLGLVFMAMGFITIAIGAFYAIEHEIAGAQWLLLTYLFHTIGELTLSPVGLSAVSKLAPKRFLGQLMGIWFLASSLGAILAGIISGKATDSGIETMPTLFMQIAIISLGFGIIFILISFPIKKYIE
tara:strand:- start:3247 stop:4704 length:1458 start_codon:yes stop_codon:yes gene_type:complete